MLVTWSHDMKYAAVTPHYTYTSVNVYETATNSLIYTWRQSLSFMAFSPVNYDLATILERNVFVLRDVRTDRVQKVKSDESVRRFENAIFGLGTHLCWSPDGSCIMTICNDGIMVWRLSDPESILVLIQNNEITAALWPLQDTILLAVRRGVMVLNPTSRIGSSILNPTESNVATRLVDFGNDAGLISAITHNQFLSRRKVFSVISALFSVYTWEEEEAEQKKEEEKETKKAKKINFGHRALNIVWISADHLVCMTFKHFYLCNPELGETLVGIERGPFPSYFPLRSSAKGTVFFVGPGRGTIVACDFFPFSLILAIAQSLAACLPPYVILLVLDFFEADRLQFKKMESAEKLFHCRKIKLIQSIAAHRGVK